MSLAKVSEKGQLTYLKRSGRNIILTKRAMYESFRWKMALNWFPLIRGEYPLCGVL